MKFSQHSTCLILIFLLLNCALSTTIGSLNQQMIVEAEIGVDIDSINPSRILQSGQLGSIKSSSLFHSLLNNINLNRESDGLSALTQNSRLDQVLGQWYERKAMPLTSYLQLMGILRVQIYQFQQMPLDYLDNIIERECSACYSQKFTEIAGLIRQQEGEYYVVIAVVGGSGSKIKKFSLSQINNIVNSINQESGKQNIQTTVTNNVPEILEEIPSSSNLQNQNSPNYNSGQNELNNNKQTTELPLTSQQNQQSQPAQINRSQPEASNYQFLLPSGLRNQQINTQQSPSTSPAVTQPQTEAQLTLTAEALDSIEVIPQNVAIDSQSLPLVAQTNFGTTPINNLVLSHDLPRSFLKGQTFIFKGSLTSANPSGLFVNVIFTRRNDSQKMSFNKYLEANQRQFQIQAYLQLSGDFFLAIFSGFRGAAMSQLFAIEQRFIENLVSRKPNSIEIAELEMQQNDLYLSWDHDDIAQPGLTKLRFVQGSRTLTTILSNYVSSCKISFKDFALFRQGQIRIYISQAFSNTQSANSRTSQFSEQYQLIVNAVRHRFADFRQNSGISQFDLKIREGGQVVLSGVAAQPVSNEIIIQTPYRTFETHLIDKTKTRYVDLPAGSAINIRIPFTTPGVYIFQVNDAQGAAIINVPVYVGDIWPFLPDFRDLSPRRYNTSALNLPTDLTSRRKIVFDLINQARVRFNVQPIVQDARLNNFAQNYSQRMINQNFFGHVDPQGTSPSQRAREVGIMQGVGQNIAININLTQAQLSLERSPAHLRNMVMKSWTRVGLGIAQNSRGHYYLTQQFSSRDMTLNPLTRLQINEIKLEIIDYLMEKYPRIRSEDVQVSNVLQEYQDSGANGNVGTFLRSKGINRNILLFNMVVSFNGGNYMQLIERTSHFNLGNANFNNVGLTVAYKDGMLEVFGAFS